MLTNIFSVVSVGTIWYHVLMHCLEPWYQSVLAMKYLLDLNCCSDSIWIFFVSCSLSFLNISRMISPLIIEMIYLLDSALRIQNHLVITFLEMKKIGKTHLGTCCICSPHYTAWQGTIKYFPVLAQHGTCFRHLNTAHRNMAHHVCNSIYI